GPVGRTPQGEGAPAPAAAVQAAEKDEEGTRAISDAVAKLLGNLRVRGYTQLRYNRWLHHFGLMNPQFVNEQGDRSIGENNGFMIRRARLILFGDVHPLVSIYFQPDFANTIGDVTHIVILRDWYADLFLTESKQLRFRVGQSKVPFGFENMQSSQNRLPLDRNDALNSAVKDERDLGVFFYAETTEARRRFKLLVDEGLKGSGDYGVFGFGAYNGQTANRRDLNDNFHWVARLAYPFQIGGQFIEPGIAAYTGRYVIKKDKGVGGPDEFQDRRAQVQFVLYPQPFGIQAEYNVGTGPQYELDGAARTPTVRQGFLHGGYVVVSWRFKELGVIPFARGTMYDGGKKFETNAPRYHVREVEAGVEWQVFKNLELTGTYLTGVRTNPQSGRDEFGRVLRMQLQVNY
ncbi:MAG: porin, partial [Myxococcales bacterium]